MKSKRVNNEIITTVESFTLNGVCDAMVSGLNLHVHLWMKSKRVNNEMITTVESFTL